MSIKENLEFYNKKLPETTELVAVSKTKPNSFITEAYEAGQRIFGENKVQDLAAKQVVLPQDIKWHFIGHLQRNKVKFIAPFVNTIHAVDSFRLLNEINKQAKINERTINCLLQFHIAEEETKFGLDLKEATELLQNPEFSKLQNINIAGVMGMATFSTDMDLVRREFKKLKSYFDTLKSEFFAEQGSFKEISMGMSGDYEIAIEEGSTMIRIGTGIFGARGN